MTKVEIVYQPRSEWPKSVRDLIESNCEVIARASAARIRAAAEGHTVPLCRDATTLGEGCPIANCRCICHKMKETA